MLVDNAEFCNEDRRENKYRIVDECGRLYQVCPAEIPANFSIWNAGILCIGDRYFLKLYNNDKVHNFSVDITDLKAIEVTKQEAEEISKHYSTGGRNPKENQRALKSKDKYIRMHAEGMKPYIKLLFNIGWED